VTKDRSLAAHYEHTVALTESGPEVLTAREDDGTTLSAPEKESPHA